MFVFLMEMTGASCCALTGRFRWPPEKKKEPDQLAPLVIEIALLLNLSTVAFSSSQKSKKLLKLPRPQPPPMCTSRKDVGKPLSRTPAYVSAVTPGPTWLARSGRPWTG